MMENSWSNSRVELIETSTGRRELAPLNSDERPGSCIPGRKYTGGSVAYKRTVEIDLLGILLYARFPCRTDGLDIG